jgi:hypothetical protein
MDLDGSRWMLKYIENSTRLCLKWIGGGENVEEIY